MIKPCVACVVALPPKGDGRTGRDGSDLPPSTTMVVHGGCRRCRPPFPGHLIPTTVVAGGTKKSALVLLLCQLFVNWAGTPMVVNRVCESYQYFIYFYLFLFPMERAFWAMESTVRRASRKSRRSALCWNCRRSFTTTIVGPVAPLWQQ